MMSEAKVEPQTLTQSVSWAAILNNTRLCGVVAALLGILFIGVAGFAPIEAMHNAAHNTRHAINFPCH